VADHYDQFSPEHGFLLRLLQDNSEQDEVLRAAVTGIDWQHLFTIAPSNLLPYLAYRLSALGLDRYCSEELWQRARDVRRSAAARYLQLRRETSLLLALFASNGVELVVLKGVVLGRLVYPDPSLRMMSDIDLLLRPRDAVRAIELAAAAGFTCPDRHQYAHPTVLRNKSRIRGQEISLPLQKPGSLVLLELHTQLEIAQPSFDIATEDIWARAECALLDGIPIHLLEKHDFLFHLVLHLSRNHVFNLGLRPLLDVHLWVRMHRDRLDWEWLAAETVARGYAPWVYLSLKIARDALDTPIPAGFFASLPAPPDLDVLERLAYRQIWDGVYRFQGLSLALSGGSPIQILLSLLRRIQPFQAVEHSFKTIPPIKTGGLRIAFRRLRRELPPKFYEYFRGLRSGQLTRSVLHREVQLLQERRQIEAIIDRAAAVPHMVTEKPERFAARPTDTQPVMPPEAHN
jgi:hypothetical protein